MRLHLTTAAAAAVLLASAGGAAAEQTRVELADPSRPVELEV